MLRALPIIVLAVVIMIVCCYGQAAALYALVPVDFLSAVLATSPGGTDIAVIIGLETESNLAIIMPLQILRLLSVLLLGPFLARWVTSITAKRLTSAVGKR